MYTSRLTMYMVAELVEAHDVLVFSYILSSISSVGEQTQLANEVILFVPEESWIFSEENPIW